MKSAIREAMRARLSILSESERLAAATTIVENLVTHPFFLQSQHIACYFSTASECDTTLIIQAIWQAQKSCYLPALNKQKLHFVEYHPDSVLLPNQYGIPEPRDVPSKSLHQLDLVIMPLAAFDRAGRRLGQGGGYYDRTFAFRQSDSNPPYLLGLAFSVQEVDALISDPWDVNLDGVITECGWRMNFQNHLL